MFQSIFASAIASDARSSKGLRPMLRRRAMGFGMLLPPWKQSLSPTADGALTANYKSATLSEVMPRAPRGTGKCAGWMLGFLPGAVSPSDSFTDQATRNANMSTRQQAPRGPAVERAPSGMRRLCPFGREIRSTEVHKSHQSQPTISCKESCAAAFTVPDRTVASEKAKSCMPIGLNGLPLM